MHSLYRMVKATSVLGVMKMGNIVLRAGVEPTSLAFWASVLTITPPMLPDATTVPTNAYLTMQLLAHYNI